MRTKFFINILLLSFLISSCSIKAGYRFNYKQVHNIKTGESTQAQIVDIFGAPESQGIKDGHPMWVYFYVKVPIFGGKAEGTMLTVEFNEEKAVSSYSYLSY